MARRSTISNDTSLAALSEFDYFRPTVLQAAIVKEFDDTIKANANTADTTIYFDIPGVPNVYRDLSNTFLEVKCYVVKLAGTTNEDTTLAPADVVAPVNNMLHSMFTDCEIKLCGTQITDKEPHYAYRAMIETLLSTRSEVLETRNKLAGWELDRSADSMDRVIVEPTNNVNPNPQFVSRRKLTEQSRKVTLIGRLHADMFHQDLDVPPSCTINIKLSRSKDEFVLQAAENSKFVVRIVSAEIL